MKRRSFIKKVGTATAATFVLPYILPSGRLFAATGARRANHVVFCLFAGGVRNLESMQKKDGNLMRYTLSGTEPISSDILGGMSPLPPPSGQALQNFGTLFKEFRYGFGPTGHFNGHTTAVTGVYTTTDLNIKEPPKNPTVFEYYRKHNSPVMSPLNAWWVSNTLGPYPSLNYSVDPSYGALYGANYIQPTSLISQQGYSVLGNPKVFSAAQSNSVKSIRNILDKNFGSQYQPGDAGVVNPESDAVQLENFIKNTYSEALSGMYIDPWGIGGNNMNNDMYNVFFAEKIIQQFKPELLVVNMQDVDVCHADYTQYANNLRKADYALAHLWNTIQSTPGMANDTILIAAPEHGRNLSQNTIMDAYGRYALDHTGEPMSREIFCMVLGPAGKVKQGQVISSVSGESIDIVPTICDVLGYYSDIPLSYRNRMGQPLLQAFV
jgi:hypothetical protein